MQSHVQSGSSGMHRQALISMRPLAMPIFKPKCRVDQGAQRRIHRFGSNRLLPIFNVMVDPLRLIHPTTVTTANEHFR